MKYVLGLVALLSSLAFGGRSDKSWPPQMSSRSGGDVGVPIREARFNVKIEKHSFTMEPEYEWKTETVCITAGTFVVYQGPIEGNQADNRASCDSTLGGKPVKVVIPGGMGINKVEIAGSESDAKFLLTGLYVKDSSNHEMDSLKALQFVVTRDLSTPSLVALVSPLSWEDSLAENPALTEYFSADVDVEDKQ